MQHRQYQQDAIAAVRQALHNHKRVMLYSPTGSGKCLGAGTPIIMANGRIIAIENICVGDFLLAPNGDKLLVKSTTTGIGKLFIVTPTKGMPYITNEEHIVSLKMTGNKDMVLAANGQRCYPGDVVNISVRDWMRSTKTFKHCAKTWRPCALEFHTTQQPLLIPPYILGLWLGDGALHAPALTNIDNEIITAWYAYAASIQHRVSIDDNHGNRCPTYHINTGRTGGKTQNIFTTHLKSLGLFKNKKTIPMSYKTATIHDRLELLAGLVDTDGHLAGGYFDFVFKDKMLAEDIAFVARSVGLFASSVAPCQKEATNGSAGPQTYYRFSVCGDINKIPCRVTRKRAACRKQKKSALMSGISIEYCGVGKYYGFEIDGPNKLFLLGDFQVTHNTEVAIQIIKLATQKRKRVAFIANRINLVNQASKRFNHSNLPHGIIQGDNSHHIGSDVVICSIDTLARRGYPEVDLLVIDEAHACASEKYRKLLEAYNNVPTIGLSATPFTKGLGREYHWGKPFETMVVATTIRDLIAQGYLVDCEIYAPEKEYEPDVSKIKIVRGEYDERQSAEAIDKQRLVGNIVTHWKQLAQDKPTVVFAQNIAHSKHIVAEFLAAGVSAEHIDCYTTDDDREAALQRHDDGTTIVLSCVSILAEGWNSPRTSCLIVARITRSLTRWIQMVGRALRPHDGKTIATILDHAGNCHRLGYPTDDLPMELDDGKTNKQTDAQPQERLPRCCPNCRFMIPAGQGACPKCGCVPQKQNHVEHAPGKLQKIDRYQLNTAQKQELWSGALGLAEQRNKSIGWAKHLYNSLTKQWPSGLQDIPCVPSERVIKMATHNAIAYHKSKRHIQT